MIFHMTSDFATENDPLRRGGGAEAKNTGKEKIMRTEEFEYPYGGTLYRTPGEIRTDIRRIAEKIREVDQRLNIRDMVVETLCTVGGDPKKLVTSLEGLVEDAHAALDTLGELEGKLDDLRAELEESRCRTILF